MNFDPDKFLSEVEPQGEQGFDPDRFLAEIEPPKEPESDIPGAVIEGAGQGFTFGHLPQLQAKMEPLTDRVFNLLPGEDVEPAPWSQLFSNDENYLKARDHNHKRIEEIAKRNPKTYYASQIAGAMALGAAASPSAALQGTARLKQAAKLGGAYGALTNPGDIEGVVEEAQLPERAKNAAIGAITALGFQKGIDAIAKYSAPLAKKLSEAAERRAAKALGLQKHLRKNYTQEQVQKIGRHALDEDIVKPSIFKNTDKMVQRNKKALSEAADDMDDVFTVIDDAGASEFNPLDTAVKVDDELGGFWRDPINKAETRQFENTIETILNRGDKTIPIKEAQALKSKLGKVANWKNSLNVTEKEKIARDASRVVTQAVDEAVEKGAEKIGVAGLGEKLKAARAKYSAGKDAETILKNRVDMEQGNRFISLTDFLVGTGATSSMGPGGLAVLGVKKIADKYGNQVTSRFLDRMAKGINKTPGLTHLSDKNPAAFQALVYKLAVKNESKLGRSAFQGMKAADSEGKELKGRDRWIGKGLDHVSRESKKINLEDPKVIKKLLMDKKGEQLLIKASGKKKRSRALSSVIKEIENFVNEEDNERTRRTRNK